MTAADTFREIDNLAAEARRLLMLGPDNPTSRTVRGHIEGVQIRAREGLTEALANQPKLEAFDDLLGIAKSALLHWTVMAADTSLLTGERQGAREKASAAREIIAEATATNTGEPT